MRKAVNTATSAILQQVPLFEPLNPEALAGIVERFGSVELEAGDILFREGDPGGTLFIVAVGQIEVIKSFGAPGERLVGLLGPSEYFGEMSLFNLEQRRTASARAVVKTHLLSLAKPDFDVILQAHPSLAYDMVRVLSRRLDESNNRTIKDLMKINQDLVKANADLVEAQAQLIEKEKLERELQVGREIQRSILPQSLPAIPGIDLGVLMEPARAVGGDFYDVIHLKNDKTALVIGDVTDKGIPAAIFMAQTYALIHAAIGTGLSPRATLLKVNKSLLEMNADGLFATALYGILDLKTHEFHYARAGHETPVIAVDGSPAVEQPFQPGQPLGILENPLIDEQRIQLPAGSCMLLYTDGLTDNLTRRPDQNDDSVPTSEFVDEQKKRWKELFTALRRAPAQDICEAIYHAFSRPPQFDDITLMVLKIAS